MPNEECKAENDDSEQVIEQSTRLCIPNDTAAAIEFIALLGALATETWEFSLCAFPSSTAFCIANPRSVKENRPLQDELVAWLNARHAARDEIYFHVAEMSPDFYRRVKAGRSAKAAKTDAIGTSFAWTDIDIKSYVSAALGLSGAAGGARAHAQAEQARISALVADKGMLIAAGTPGLPTLCIASGGGQQPIYQLDIPKRFEGDGARAIIELVESHNKGISAALGGDDCHNIDRILRMPGTVNWAAKQTKVAKGQVAALAHVSAYRPEIKQRLLDFPRVRADGATASAASSTGGSGVSAANVTKVDWCRAEPKELPGGVEALIENLEKWGVSPRTSERIVHGGNELDPKAYDSRSENVFGIVRELLRKGVPDEHIMWLITDEMFAISDHCRDPEKNKGHRGMLPYAQRQITNGKIKNAKDAAKEAAREEAVDAALGGEATAEPADAGGNGGGANDSDDGKIKLPPIFDKGAYSAMARAYRDEMRPTLLVGPSGEFMAWNNASYEPIDQALIDHDVHMFLETARVRVPVGRRKVTVNMVDILDTRTVNETRNALVRIQTVPADRLDLPCWLKPEPGDLPAHEIISFPNTLLHVPSGQTFPQTSRFFTRNALEFDYMPNAPRPNRFMQFLTETWSGDETCEQLAQEWAGYLLTPDTSHHKILLMSGVQRGGKGTFARVMESLVGKTNTCWPEANDFGERFGGEALIGKSLAIVPEFDLDRSTPIKRIVSRLKSYAGGDSFSVQRKNKKNWEGRPSTRIIILSNAVLNLPDPSGALAGRFLPLPIENSAFGREDIHLEEKLKAELPGILLWAIEGWKRLRARKEFVLGEASKAEQDKIANSSSPLRNFIDDALHIDPAAKGVFTPRSELYPVYQRWARANGLGVMGMQAFCNALEATTGRKIKLSRPAGKERGFVGVTITDQCQPRVEETNDFYEAGLARAQMTPSMAHELMLDEHDRRRPMNGHAFDSSPAPS